MNDKQRLMIKIAKLYYESGLTQDEISRNLRLSRPKVSRLMQEAIKMGVVKISILQEPGSYADLERQLEQKYNLTGSDCHRHQQTFNNTKHCS